MYLYTINTVRIKLPNSANRNNRKMSDWTQLEILKSLYSILKVISTLLLHHIFVIFCRTDLGRKNLRFVGVILTVVFLIFLWIHKILHFSLIFPLIWLALRNGYIFLSFTYSVAEKCLYPLSDPFFIIAVCSLFSLILSKQRSVKITILISLKLKNCYYWQYTLGQIIGPVINTSTLNSSGRAILSSWTLIQTSINTYPGYTSNFLPG